MGKKEGMHRGWILAVGIVLILVGFLAMMMPLVTTLAIELLLGWLFLIGGIVQIVASFFSKKWGGFFSTLAVGFIFVFAGLFLLRYPLGGALTLALLLALTFLIQGTFEIFLSLRVKPEAG